MPHITVKVWPGKPAEGIARMSDEIVDSVCRNLGYEPGAVSVGIEEVAPADWMSAVYEPDIAARWDHLTHKPNYGPGKSA